MIAVGETDPTAAEIPFWLPLTADTFTGPGLTGYVVAAGEVQIKLPGASWVNVDVSQIVEKGFGRYCVRLTSGQTGTAGTAYIRTVSIPGCQPYFGQEDIGQLGGDFQVGQANARLPFYLPLASDPIYGTPLTSHTFAPGEVKVCVPGGSYVDADVSAIFNVGFGAWELQLTPAQTANRGKVFIYALVSGYQRWEGYATILNPSGGVSVGGGSGGSSALTTTSPAVSSPLGINAAGYVDHVGAALARLPLQYRTS